MTAQELEKLLAEVTPGEWSDNLWGEPTAVACGRRLIASSGGYSDGKDGTRSQNIANARLIAIAPTLARRVIAAEKLAEALTYYADKRAYCGSGCTNALDSGARARAALAEWEAAQ